MKKTNEQRDAPEPSPASMIDFAPRFKADPEFLREWELFLSFPELNQSVPDIMQRKDRYIPWYIPRRWVADYVDCYDEPPITDIEKLKDINKMHEEDPLRFRRWLKDIFMPDIVEAVEKKREQKRATASELKDKQRQPAETDTLLEKFQKECKARNLRKGKTIPRGILYEIARAIGIPGTPDSVEEFTSKHPAYHYARDYASRLRYKKKYHRERNE